MNSKVYINDYCCISPLGLEKMAFKSNLKNAAHCFSKISQTESTISNVMALIPGQKLTSSLDIYNLEGIAQKKKWIDLLFNSADILSNNKIDLIIYAHNTDFNLISYNYFKQSGTPVILCDEEITLFTPKDIDAYLNHNALTDSKTERIHLHNMCASTAAAMALALKRLQLNLSKNILIVSMEVSNNNPYLLMALKSLGVLNTNWSENKTNYGPFANQRSGFIKADSINYLLLSNKPNNPIAEIVSAVNFSESHSLTESIESGSSIAMAMEECLKNAQVKKEQIDYLNAHGSGTYSNDLAEARAIEIVFPCDLYSLPTSSTKSQSGHALCASGGIEISSILAMFEEKFIAGNINCVTQDEEININILKKPVLNKRIDYAFKNSLGMGGYNSCMILKNET